MTSTNNAREALRNRIALALLNQRLRWCDAPPRSSLDGLEDHIWRDQRRQADAILNYIPELASIPTLVPAQEAAAITAEQLGEIMQEEWSEICDDAQAHPQDIQRHGRSLWYSPRHWTAAIADRLNARIVAPAPAAGEAVAWWYRNEDSCHPTQECVVLKRWPDKERPGWTEHPLYAAPQPPATGGDAEERVARAIYDIGCTFDEKWEHAHPRTQMTYLAKAEAAIAALANHSPDAGGVGEDAVETAASAFAKVFYGPGFDPFHNPEAFDLVMTAMRTALRPDPRGEG